METTPDGVQSLIGKPAARSIAFFDQNTALKADNDTIERFGQNQYQQGRTAANAPDGFFNHNLVGTATNTSLRQGQNPIEISHSTGQNVTHNNDNLERIDGPGMIAQGTNDYLSILDEIGQDQKEDDSNFGL